MITVFVLKVDVQSWESVNARAVVLKTQTVVNVQLLLNTSKSFQKEFTRLTGTLVLPERVKCVKCVKCVKEEAV